MMRYDFKCDSCDHVEELEFIIAQAPDGVMCEKCGSNSTRQLAIFGFSIKHQFTIVNQPPGRNQPKSDSSKNLVGKGGGFEPQ